MFRGDQNKPRGLWMMTKLALSSPPLSRVNDYFSSRARIARVIPTRILVKIIEASLVTQIASN